MKLGSKVFFIDTDNCKAIRKGTVTCINSFYGYFDYLSSKPDREIQGTTYTVCAVKDGSHQYFKPDKVFESMADLRSDLADTILKGFDIFE